MDKHGIAILADNPLKAEEIAKAFENSGRFTIIGKRRTVKKARI